MHAPHHLSVICIRGTETEATSITYIFLYFQERFVPNTSVNFTYIINDHNDRKY